mgnify:CR=1 FL=1
MKNKRLLITAVMTLLLAGASHAQSSDWKSYSYIEAQGGVQLTSTNAPMDKLITPTAALSFGHYFTPVVGARLHVNAWESKSGFKDLDKYYKWKYITPDLDLLINLSNLFGKNHDRLLNVIFLGGIGLNYAWDNDELKDMKLPVNMTPLAWDKNRLSHNLRAGLRLETNMQKPLGVSLEVNANSLDDRFNSKTNDADDWMFTAMLGISYRFGHKAKKVAPVPVVREIEEVIEEEVPVMKKFTEKRPVTKTEAVKLHKEVFYDIRISDNIDPSIIMAEVAKFMKENPQSKITVTGYADKGTGNPRINVTYAKRRADQFTKDLIERHGCNAANIITDSKGDTVQPFAENDKNRCVIIEGEGTKEVTIYEEYEVEREVMEKVKKTVKRQVTE